MRVGDLQTTPVLFHGGPREGVLQKAPNPPFPPHPLRPFLLLAPCSQGKDHRFDGENGPVESTNGSRGTRKDQER